MRLVPVLLAVFFGLWALRVPSPDNLVDTDAARHAMNGAFIHDLVRDGKFSEPVQYARSYYSRLPAISMPYHPPLFPFFESIFFWGLGVNWLAARLAVAAAAAVSVVLFYRLLLATHGSHALALFATLTFFSLPSSQRVASDVMLEFPALAFLLGSLYFVRDLDRGFPMWRGVGFALLAGAAVWTKQTALFLGLVPFALVVIERRWRLLRGKTIWLASAVFGVLVALLAAFSMSSGLAGNQGWPRRTLAATLAHNLAYYADAIRDEIGLAAALFVAIAFAVLLARRLGALYVAWAGSVFALLLFLPPYDLRYLFFAYPALVVIGYTALFRLVPGRRAWYAPAAAACLAAAVNLSAPRVYLDGPAEAARTIAAMTPERVLYCGRTNGTFMFSMRSLDSRSAVIRGDKLPASIFEPGEFEKFAHQYGITHIVLESRGHLKKDWDGLFASPSPSMKLIREIPLVSSEEYLKGRLRLFQFTNPSHKPESTLKLRMMSGGDLEVEF